MFGNIRTALRARFAAERRALAAAAPPGEPRAQAAGKKRAREPSVEPARGKELAQLAINRGPDGPPPPLVPNTRARVQVLPHADALPWAQREARKARSRAPPVGACGNTCACSIWSLSQRGLYSATPPALVAALKAADLDLRRDKHGGRVLRTTVPLPACKTLFAFTGATREVTPSSLFHPYEMTIASGTTVVPYPCSPASYLNHSASPNCEVRISARGAPAVRSLRFIGAGEPLTFHYWAGREGSFSQPQVDRTLRAIASVRALAADDVQTGDIVALRAAYGKK